MNKYYCVDYGDDFVRCKSLNNKFIEIRLCMDEEEGIVSITPTDARAFAADIIAAANGIERKKP